VSDGFLAPEPALTTQALIGYGRVSTKAQLLDRQMSQLTELGCTKIFTDKLSGRDVDRPQLKACLEYLRPGDTLVVTSLDRLARSLQELITLVADLRRRGVGFRSLHEAIDTTTPGGRLVFHIFAALAEFVRELIVQGTNEGLDAARARGVRLGRPPALTGEQVQQARHLLTKPDQSVSSIARLLGVSRSTLYAHVPELATRTVPALAAAATSSTQGPAPLPEPDAVLTPPAPTSVPETERPALEVAADPEMPAATGRVVDLTSELGLPGTWRLLEVEEGSWRLERDGAGVGSIQRHTTRGRRGWRAQLATGIDLPAYGHLAVTTTSDLWRSRDLAAAAIAQRLVD
jgi:DNA invertase Pin-like site-specific DNA recombinase